MKITIFDTETTNLTLSEGNDVSVQPYMTELYAAQIENNKLIKEIDTLIKPPIKIPNFITKLTGITNDAVSSAPTFIEIYKDIIPVFLGSEYSVAHNLSFDESILEYELIRIGKLLHFPWPPKKFCTVEQSMHIKGYRLKNSELYTIATGKEMINAHRAKHDVMATYASYMWLLKQNGKVCG